MCPPSEFPINVKFLSLLLVINLLTNLVKLSRLASSTSTSVNGILGIITLYFFEKKSTTLFQLLSAPNRPCNKIITSPFPLSICGFAAVSYTHLTLPTSHWV